MVRGRWQLAPRLLQALVSVGVCGALASQVRAQSSDYEDAIDQAVAEFQAGHWHEARTLFERAHALAPSARTLRGLGIVAFELRHYARSARLLQQALEDTRQPLTQALQAQTRELVQRAIGFVGRYRIALQPPDAMLSVDGAKAQLEPDGSLWLDPGEHTLRARAPGHREAVQELDVRGGEQLELTLALEPLRQPPAAQGSPALQEPASKPPAPAPQAGQSQSSLLPSILALSVGGLGLGTFAVLGGLAMAEDADLEQSCSPSCTDDRISQFRGLILAADIGLAVGLAGALVGTVLLLARDGEQGRDVAVVPVVGPDAAGVSAAGRF